MKLSYKQRFYFIGACLLFYAAFIWIQTWHTLVVHGDDYRAKVEKLKRDAKPIDPVRGFIFANHGEMLAGSLPEYDVFLDFNTTTRPDANGKINIPADTIAKYFGVHGEGSQALANAYSDPKYNVKSAEQFGAEIREAYRQHKGYYRIFRAMPYLDYRHLRKQPYFNKSALRNGLIKEERAHRYRPYGENRMASATIGSVWAKNGKDSTARAGHGRGGIEQGFDTYLAGTPGKGYLQRIHGRMSTVTIEQPVDGADVYTTLDMEMQEILDQELANQLVKLNAAEGWAAFVEVKTGKIRAISNLRNNRNGTCSEDYNHLFSDLGAPGSTFKTVSYMILLDNGKIKPDTKVDTENYPGHYGTFNYYGKSIRDDHPVGVCTAREGIEQSSNIAIAKLTTAAYEDDPKAYLNAVNRIGFLDDHALSHEEVKELETKNILPIEAFKKEFPNALSARHRWVGDRAWRKMSLAQISYGYETDIPGIYILQFYNAIANDGCLVRPYIVERVVKDGEELYKQETTVINRKICSRETLREVREALEDVVTKGTARTEKNRNGIFIRDGAESDKVRIAGKTGTAQRRNPITGLYSGNGHNVSFAGYFPADEPAYCGIVVINTNGYKGGLPGGGFMAGPVFRRFAERVYALHGHRTLDDLPADSVAPRDAVVKREANLADAGMGGLPDVRGMGASDALLMLETAGYTHVEIHGFGTVKTQTFHNGTVSLDLK